MADRDRERIRGEVLPELNLLVRITLGSSADPEDPPWADDLPSRVEDVRPGRPGRRPEPVLLFVAAPSYPGDHEPPAAGTAVTVTWLTTSGLFALPTVFAGRESVGPAIRAWRLRVSGPATRAQRRRYVRVPMPAPITVLAGEQSLPGRVVDLSEGGLRCTLPLPPLPAGAGVVVLLSHHGEEMELAATVVRSRLQSTPNGRVVETALNFDDPGAQADALRRLVFGEQLRARRAGLA